MLYGVFDMAVIRHRLSRTYCG